MNPVIVFLAFLCFAAAAAGIALWKRRRSRKDRMRAVTLQPEKADSVSGPYELAAIDQLLYDRTCRYMTEYRPFLVTTFSLQDLSNAVFTNKYYLSKTINRFSGKNFRQYVNYYRIMYAVELFRDNNSLRVSELASLSGFHSITSFTQNFKKVMGDTPSFWCERIRKKNAERLRKNR